MQRGKIKHKNPETSAGFRTAEKKVKHSLFHFKIFSGASLHYDILKAKLLVFCMFTLGGLVQHEVQSVLMDFPLECIFCGQALQLLGSCGQKSLFCQTYSSVTGQNHHRS